MDRAWYFLRKLGWVTYVTEVDSAWYFLRKLG